jgi:periplasmic protein TonB
LGKGGTERCGLLRRDNGESNHEIRRLELRQQDVVGGRRREIETRHAGRKDRQGDDRDADDGEWTSRAPQGQHEKDCPTRTAGWNWPGAPVSKHDRTTAPARSPHFRQTLARRPHAARAEEACMRAWTLGVSIVFHLCVITGAVVAPLFATGDLPEPPRAFEHVIVSARMPDSPVMRRLETPARTLATFPTEAPEAVVSESLKPEPPADPIDFGIGGTNDAAGAGFLPGNPTGTVAGNDLIPPALVPVTPLRVGGAIRAPQRIRDVAPRYPAIAQASRVEGIVILEAVIEEDGSVRDVRVLRSKPLLDEAAIEAVRQWRFTPTLLNGQPVPVVMTVTVSFSLK